MAQLVTLFGVQTLKPTIDNNFSLVYNSNVRSENVNEVRILVDTSLQVVPAQVNIYLPPTIAYNGIYTTQIYIVDVSGTASTNAIRIYATGGDNIDGSAYKDLTTAYGNVVLTIASQGYYTSYGSGGSGGGGGGAGVTLPYADFYDLMSNQQLVVGQTYRINDYRAVNFYHGVVGANNNNPPITYNAGFLDNSFVNTGVAPQTSFNGLCVLADDSILCVQTSPTGTYPVYKVDANGNPVNAFNQNQGTGGDFTVLAIVQQTDGKILVGGAFTTYNGNAVGGLIRLNADGTIDNSFLTNLGTGFNGQINAIKVQADGKILVGGLFVTLNGNPIANNITRLNADGTLDAVFDANLLGGTDTFVRTIFIQSDTDILIGGAFTVVSGVGTTRMARLTINGVLDLAFNATINGAGGFDNEVYKIIQQPNTDILVMGRFSLWNGNPYDKMIRMTIVGNDDPLFNGNFFIGNSFNNSCYDMVLQNNGFIVFAGDFSILQGFPSTGIVRVDNNGVVDFSFTSVFYTSSYTLGLQSTGKIIVGQNSTYITRSNLYRLFDVPTASTYDARAIHTSSEIETLVVKALTNCTIEQEVFSEQYPNDIIYYIAQCNKIGCDLEIYNGQTLPDSTVVAGFDIQWDGTNAYFDLPTNYPALFGHYFYIYADFSTGERIDMVFEPLSFGVITPSFEYYTRDNRIQVSSDGKKVILLGLTQNDVLNYVPSSLYVDMVQSIGDSYGYISRRHDVVLGNDFPIDYRNFKYRRYMVTTSQYNNLNNNFFSVSDNWGYGGVNGLYADFYIVNNFDAYWNSNSRYDAFSNSCKGIGGADGYYWYLGAFDNCVVLTSCYKNEWRVESIVVNVTLGTLEQSTFTSLVRNLYVDYFYRNTLGNTNSCAIGTIQSCLLGLQGSFGNNNLTAMYDVTAQQFDNNALFYTIQNVRVRGFQNNIMAIVPLFPLGIFDCNFVTFSDNALGCSIQLSNIDFFGSNQLIGFYFSENNGIYFGANTITDTGNSFANNTFNRFISNSLNVGCTNFRSNVMEGEFTANAFSGNFTENRTGNRFLSNFCNGNWVSNSIGVECDGNNFFGLFERNQIGDRFRLNNITLGNAFTNNAIGNNFESNTFAVNNFNENVIEAEFANNVMTGAFIGGANFNYNTISCVFKGNTLYEGNFVENLMTATSGFLNNAINSNFSYNLIQNRVANCTTAGAGAQNFQANIINTPLLGVDFTPATLVYLSYNKTILIASTGVTYISYYNGVAQQYVTPVTT